MPINNAAVRVSHLTLAIQDRPVTPPGPNEVLVQVISTGICGSDTHNWNNPNVSRELILGHESAGLRGLIVEIDSEVKDRHVGQRMAVEPGFACATRKCPDNQEDAFCLRGNPNTCANLKYCGLDPTDGTLQQYFTCKAHMAIPIPEEISWEEAGAIQPLAIAVQLARRAALSATAKVVGDGGCGPLGLLVIAIAKAYGVCKIVVFDIEQSRLDFALSYGEDIGVLSPKISENVEPLKFVFEFTSSVVREHNLGHGVDISVEASGADSSAQMALTILKPRGTCIQAGLGKRLTKPLFFLLIANELTLRGRSGSRRDVTRKRLSLYKVKSASEAVDYEDFSLDEGTGGVSGTV
ncbi:hypothetical protein AN3700.2 [Aspergillus nidulans FGSC A4]|uniref:Enoyl reductase (ER) domain-containing protein n=1 Tax=Emericella nidulans (strain FGSC A4 / ATCC 38163 / CBS 112.46 / NRRL 194 / M139) TaxID=227321 RepID=Q5B6Y0_EMENI|nr:hypothetical protein [Aspergillus nidulans FGSC A4]EAA59908.1 hypothetical protein AN3700.2 [Aspergillus nidulans FGSC A4]CBF75582.1 TPA: conserved hypothetical protein [Aspergillus nidulans FGSC A4]|eukprot:XP_661304.1 hypothetical protein AN3700.2 [Aspergillus nidulans FGSC A4]